MKAYTDLEQSKKLAEILPLESADLWWSRACIISDETLHIGYSVEPINLSQFKYTDEDIPCWSLAALLSVIPNPSLHKTFSGWRCDSYNKEGTSFILSEPSDNPVDACVEMIIKLHELNLL